MKVIRSKELKSIEKSNASINERFVKSIRLAVKNAVKNKKIKKEILLGESFGLCSGLCRVFLTKDEDGAELIGKWFGDCERYERTINMREFVDYCADTNQKKIEILGILEKLGLI